MVGDVAFYHRKERKSGIEENRDKRTRMSLLSKEARKYGNAMV